MAKQAVDVTKDKKTETPKTQNVSVGGRSVNVNVPTVNKTPTTTKQSVTVGGRDVKVDVPTPKYQNKSAQVNASSTKTNMSNVTVGGRVLSNEQKNSSITQPYVDNKTNPTPQQARGSFSSDKEYENYIINNKVDFTKGDAFNYIQSKAEEQGVHPMKYVEGMRNRNRNMNETLATEQKARNGEINQNALEDLNNRYGVMLDQNGNETDVNKYNNDVNLVNQTAENINKEIEKLNSDYTKGKIDYQTMQNRYNELQAMWNENQIAGQNLNNYKVLTGFDYYDWARENGKDVTDFEAYVENFNDTMPERLAQEWASSWADTLKIVPQTLDVLAKIYDPEHEDSQATKVLSETSNELREYAFAGANQFQTWNLQAIGSLMPMINSMMIGAMLPVNTEVFTNVALGISSGAETAKRRMEEGCDVTTSIINGALHGTITGMVEGFNMGAITELVTGSPQKWLMGMGLLAKASPTKIAGMLASMGASEATEELIESFADVVADNMQNFLLGDAVGRVNADTINAKDMANEMAMAFVGTMFLGAGTATNVVINTKMKYNGAMEARRHFESVLASPIAMEEEKAVARRGIAEIDEAVKPYIQNSETAMAVDLPSDQVAPMASYNELMNNLVNAMQPDVQEELQSAMQTLKYAEQVKVDLQNSLVDRGMNIDVDKFLDMDSNKRAQYMNMSKTLSESGIQNAFTQLFPGQNGLSVEDGVIINTDQTRTLDIDTLADLDDDVASKAIMNGGNEIFKEAGSNASAESATAHEVTHYAEKSGKWEELRNAVVEMMGEKRFNKAKERLEQIYKSRGVESVDAEKEAVAFYIQKNFGNQQFLNRIADYNTSLLKRMIANARSYFNGGSLAKLENKFMRAVVDSKKIVDLSVKNGSVAPVSASIGTWEKTDVDALADAIREELNKDKTLGSEEVTSEDVQKWIDSVSSVAKMVADDIDRLEYVSNSTYSAMKKNSDYKYTIDMSTLCKKRLLLQGTIDAVQRAMPNVPLTSMDYITIRELMAKKGFEVSCGFCYVESARRLLGKVAEEFIEKSGHTDVTIADLITVDGVEDLQQTNPEIYKEFVKFNNARGQQRAMLVQTRTEYRGEIRKLTERAVADLIRKGGLRLQSYSDFETPHLIDMMQVVLDMASRGLTSQAYTKVPNFADAFGNTNIKINLSLVCKGVDENGELIFDDVEGMPHEDAFRLREKYSKNVGTILVGKDDATILSAMADPRIDYIIPFHRSGWANDEFELLGINGYENYTNEQHEKFLTSRQYEITQGKNKGKMSKPTRKPRGGDILPLSFWDFNKTGRENAVTYLEMCRQDKRIPKFSRFLEHHGIQKVDENGNPMFVESGKNQGQPIYEEEYWTLQPDGSTDGYWKTLIDFKMYDNDGNGSPQERVVPVFDDEVNRRILSEYQGGHRALRSAEDVVQEFLKMKSPEAQYSIGYNPENTWDDYDSDGNIIPENLSKYMVGSKLTNGKGQLMPLYHTSSAVFNEFNPTGTQNYRYGNQVVFFVSSNRDVSGSYARNSKYEQIKKEGDLASELSVINDIEKRKSDYYKAKEELDVLGNELDRYVGDYLSNDNVQSALNEIQSNINKFAQRPLGGEDDALSDTLIEDIDTDIRQILDGGNGAPSRFRLLSDLYDVYENGKYNFYKGLLGDGIEFEVPQEVRDLLSPLATIENQFLETRENRTKRRDEIKSKTSVASELYETWRRAEEGKPANGVQYVGYGKAVNPYVLNGQWGINGRRTNWNTINTSDYSFSQNDIDMNNVADAIVKLSESKRRTHKQGRAEMILGFVNEQNRRYLIKNPVVLANLAVIFDNDYLDYVEPDIIDDEISFQTVVEYDGLDMNVRWNDIYDMAETIAKNRGYKPDASSLDPQPFENRDWEQAKEELGIKKKIKFHGGLETNDVVKAVLAINNFIKDTGTGDEPYDGVVFKGITDSGNGDAMDIASDIIALFDSNQFKTVGNENPTSGKNMFYSLGEQPASERLDPSKKGDVRKAKRFLSSKKTRERLGDKYSDITSNIKNDEDYVYYYNLHNDVLEAIPRWKESQERTTRELEDILGFDSMPLDLKRTNYKGLGNVIIDPSHKSMNSAETKVMGKKDKMDDWGNPYTLNSIKDQNRWTVQVNDIDKIRSVIGALRDRFKNSTLEIKNGATSYVLLPDGQFKEEKIKGDNYGYTGFHITWEEDGIRKEIQVTPNFDIKLMTDEIYEKWRRKGEETLSNDEKAEKKKDISQSFDTWKSFREGRIPPVISSILESETGRQKKSGFISQDFLTQDLDLTSNSPTTLTPSTNSNVGVSSSMMMDNPLDSSTAQPPLSNSILPNNSGDNGNVVPPRKIVGEVTDGYSDRKKQQFRESNLEKSTVLDEKQKERTRQMSAEGYFSYQSYINNVEVQRAKDYMERDGIDKTFTEYMATNDISMKSVVKGEVLLAELAKNNDPRWEEVATKLADDSTVAGQTLQAYAILQRLSPRNQLVAVERNMRRMQAELDRKYGNKAPVLEVSEELKEELRTAETAEQAQKARDKIMKSLIEQQPLTWSDVFDSWRYLAMLGNPRTHIRNILGNVAFMPAVGLKNIIGTALESALKDKLSYKTKAIVSRFDKADRVLYDAGVEEFEKQRSLQEKNMKYEQKGFGEKHKLLNALNKGNSWLLENEDILFSRDRYALSYAQFLKANDLTPDNMTAEQKVRANQYAYAESLKATYRDANAIANWLNELERSNNKGLRTLGFFKKAILPFTRTPFNIIKRGVEYSGIGLLKSIYDGATAVRNGTMDATTWIDELSAGLSGTAIMGLGWLLSKMGLFRTKDDDKDRKKYFDKDIGEQDYAIDLGNGTYTLDWMSPVIMPLAMGAEFANAFTDLGQVEGADSALNAFLRIASNLADPIVETSMLSSLQDAMSSYANEGSAYLGDVITSAIASYIGQLFPTAFGQLARTTDDTRRQTSPNEGLIDKTVKQILNKTPYIGVDWLPSSKWNQPYINKKGQEEKTEDLGKGALGRFILNALSPGYYSSKDADKYDMEMLRLFEDSGQIDALPSSTTKSITFNKEPMKFSDEEYTEWHKTRWSTESKYVNQFIDSNAYKGLSDEERVETIKDIRKYAQDVAKKQFLESKGYVYTDDKELAEKQPNKYIYEKGLTNAEGAIDNGVELYAYYDYLNNAGTKQAEKLQYLESSGLSKSQKDYLWGLSDYKTSYEDVYKKVFGGEGKSSSSKKKSSSGSKSGSGKKSSKVKSTSAGGISTVRGGGKLSTLKPATSTKVSADANKRIANKFTKAYSNVFNRERKASSAGGNTIVCPKCGNRVSSGMSTCPVCGQRLS